MLGEYNVVIVDRDKGSTNKNKIKVVNHTYVKENCLWQSASSRDSACQELSPFSALLIRFVYVFAQHNTEIFALSSALASENMSTSHNNQISFFFLYSV